MYLEHKPFQLTNWKAFQIQTKCKISKSKLTTSPLFKHMHSGKDNYENGHTHTLAYPSTHPLKWIL